MLREQIQIEISNSSRIRGAGVGVKKITNPNPRTHLFIIFIFFLSSHLQTRPLPPLPFLFSFPHPSLCLLPSLSLSVDAGFLSFLLPTVVAPTSSFSPSLLFASPSPSSPAIDRVSLSFSSFLSAVTPLFLFLPSLFSLFSPYQLLSAPSPFFSFFLLAVVAPTSSFSPSLLIAVDPPSPPFYFSFSPCCQSRSLFFFSLLTDCRSSFSSSSYQLVLSSTPGAVSCYRQSLPSLATFDLQIYCHLLQVDLYSLQI